MVARFFQLLAVAHTGSLQLPRHVASGWLLWLRGHRLVVVAVAAQSFCAAYEERGRHCRRRTNQTRDHSRSRLVVVAGVAVVEAAVVAEGVAVGGVAVGGQIF